MQLIEVNYLDNLNIYIHMYDLYSINQSIMRIVRIFNIFKIIWALLNMMMT